MERFSTIIQPEPARERCDYACNSKAIRHTFTLVSFISFDYIDILHTWEAYTIPSPISYSP